MTRYLLTVAGLPALVGTASAHPGIVDHAHPHDSAASYFTLETLVIFAVGLALGGTIAWVRRRRETGK